MGIKGLIPFVQAATERVDLDKFKGKKVAIDSYGWLHKGAFGCAEKLAIGQNTDQYVRYCLNFVTALLAKKITPIMVFDGRHLPAKAEEERSRREGRQSKRQKAAQLIRSGQKSKAWSYMAASIDVTHTMALHLIQACRKIGVDSVVAPYEADSQLAFLSIQGIVDYVITEDSDLILFGCKKIIFKFQLNEPVLLYDSTKLPSVLKMSEENFDFSIFRRMCILSGCDYLSSLPGIGLAKALKFMSRTKDIDIRESLKKMSQYLNMPNLVIPEDYADNFLTAEATFLHQYVYDPKNRLLTRLNPVPEHFDQRYLSHSGDFIEPEEAFQHALGNIDPFSKKTVDSWDPDEDKLSAYSIWSSKSNRSRQCAFQTLIPTKRAEKTEELYENDEDVPEESTEDIFKLYQTDNGRKRKFDQIDEDIGNEEPEPEKIQSDDAKLTNGSIFPTKAASPFVILDKIEDIAKSPESSTAVSQSKHQLSPIIEKRKRTMRSRFLTRTVSTSVVEKSDVLSSFFRKSHSLSVIYDEKKVQTQGDTQEKNQEETLEEEEEKLNSSQQENIDLNTTIIDDDVPSRKINENVTKDVIKRSPIKTVTKPKSRQIGLSRNIASKNPVGQTLLSKFGFVKKKSL